MSDQFIKEKEENNLFILSAICNGKNAWYYYVFGIMAAMLGYFTYQLVAVSPLLKLAIDNGYELNEILKNPNMLFNSEVNGLDKNLILALMMGMFVFTLLFFISYTVRIQKKTITSIITGFNAIRWNRIVISFIVWGSLMIVSTVAAAMLFPSHYILKFNTHQFGLLLLISLILIPIQTATEEILFRGYILQGLSIGLKNKLLALCISSLFFGLLHISNPEVKTFGIGIMLPYYVMFGLFLGVLSLLDEGIELAIGIHCANNLWSCLLITAPSSVLQTDALFALQIETPVIDCLLWVAFAGLCFYILYKKYQLNNWQILKNEK